MKTTALTISTLILAASASYADHESQQVRLRGTTESDTGGVVKITEANFVAAGNFMVAFYDLHEGSDELVLQEWSDTNADGVPDNFVKDLFQRTHIARLENRKFSATLVDSASPFNSSFTVTGTSKKVDSESNQTGFSGKIAGVLIDADISGGEDAIIKATLSTVGPTL